MQTKEAALIKIKSLIKRFDEQKEFYRKGDYNETQTRRDFIDPFWKALGWDIDNENGYAESYREVIHEDRIKVGGATKAPDYSFRLVGGKRLFFLEAKKTSVFIKDEISPAYQVRRYGWSAKMPISVITDFEEFAIYDCTNKPKPTDKASNGRIKYLTYNQYIDEFDFIWDTFSKEKVLKGSFDKFIVSNKNKKGTSTVDNEFLLSLDKWRVELATNIALRNKDLANTKESITEDELNFVVQHTIDRIIFLRIAEDRSIEPYGDLQSDIKTGNFYQNLLYRFHQADQKYNSGLFDFRKDKISDKITIDNKVIKEIITELYYPICPYEFSVLSVEILGSAYEQFLGKQISLSKAGKAKIEEKPEVRKAGGVYYTPQYIVDYIVKNTVGKLIDGSTGSPLTPKEISSIKIADPACGSGSFLLGAYQYLLNWHKDYYTQKEKLSKGNKDNPLTPTGELTTQEKKRILLNNIFGVDLDSNAVEVTKLSLLLKCMEGETKESIEAQSKLFHDRILPTLDNNIKSGNSLIDLDYYDNELDFGEERKVKPFSWQKAFPEVFAKKIIEQEEKEIYHVTCVMHNSRVSKRMIEYKVKRGKPEYLAPKEEEALLEILCKIFAENNLTVLQMNLCADHLHFILVCNPNELSQIVGKVKSISARTFNILRGLTSGHANPTSGQDHLQGEQQAHLQDAQHAPLQEEQHANPPSGQAHLQEQQHAHLQEQQHAHLQKADISLPTRGETQNSLWAQKFHRKLIESNEQLHNTIAYIRNNRIKHNLPELSDSIRALIDSVLTDAEKVFEPTIIKGGFDCIIGNPPYVSIKELAKESVLYYSQKYETGKGQSDLYSLFIERGISLLNTKGMIAYIVPDSLNDRSNFITSRKQLIEQTFIQQIITLNNVFKDANVGSTIFITGKAKNKTVKLIKTKDLTTFISNELNEKETTIDKIKNTENYNFLFVDEKETEILNKLFSHEQLSEFAFLGRGEELGKKSELITTIATKNALPFLSGDDFSRYTMKKIVNYINKNNVKKDIEKLYGEKIIVRQVGKNITATIDSLKCVTPQSVYTIVPNKKLQIKYLLALLNSNLFNFIYQKKYRTKEIFPRILLENLKSLPIKTNPTKEQENDIIKLVEQLLQLNKELLTQKLPEKIEQLKNRIVYAEDKINQLVYKLYNLTTDEINMIEEQ